MTPYIADIFQNSALLDDAKVPWFHLLEVGGDGTIAQGDPPFLYISTLVRAQREMNSARETINAQMITPMLAAFAILDQIGECYAFAETLANEPGEREPIKRALHHFPPTFGPLSDEQMQSLYVMRNGLVHDASFSSSERGGLKRKMIFRHDIEMETVVVLPKREWDGTPGDVSRETITWVNPDLIIWIADSAVGRLAQALKLSDPKLVVRLDPQVIAARYLLWHRYLPSSTNNVVESVKPVRSHVRKALRAKLTEAELVRHRTRYYLE